MTVHDARMLSLVQWWKRTMRAGHAYAEGAWMHGRAHWMRQTLSVWFWGAALPLAGMALAVLEPRIVLWIAAMYLALALRIFVRAKMPPRDALPYAVFCVLGKFPQVLGQSRFVLGKWSRRPSALIEYKTT